MECSYSLSWNDRKPVRRLAAGAVLAVTTAAVLAGPARPAAAEPAASATQAHQEFLVRAKQGDLPAVTHLVTSLGGTVKRTIGLIDAVDADVPQSAVAALQADPRVASVTVNGPVHLMATTAAGTVPIPTTAGGAYDPGADPYSMFNLERRTNVRWAWNLTTGKGVDVALLDSGVAPVAGLDSPGKILYGPDLTEEAADPSRVGLDGYGHGTHLAGIIACHDTGVDPKAASDDPNPCLGVAPDARIVSVKVADQYGNSDVSQVIAGIDWVVQHAHDPGVDIRVLNLSFGTDSTQSYLVDPLAYAAEQAWKAGIVVVTAAGNSGNLDGRLTDPAIDPYVLAVGADDIHGTYSVSDDTIPGFSSRGDGVRNPDLVVPGAHIQSLRVPGSYVDVNESSAGLLPGGRFVRGSGTSQAAAAASGAVALLLSLRPELTPDQVKYAFLHAARPLPNADPQAQGHGLMSVGPWLLANSPAVSQTFLPATGKGSLQASRGTTDINPDAPSPSEADVLGNAFHSAAMAALEAQQRSWTGGTWNGAVWIGNGTTLPSSSCWTSRSWSSRSWSSRSWSSRSWSSRSWSSRSWSNRSWS